MEAKVSETEERWQQRSVRSGKVKGAKGGQRPHTTGDWFVLLGSKGKGVGAVRNRKHKNGQ